MTREPRSFSRLATNSFRVGTGQPPPVRHRGVYQNRAAGEARILCLRLPPALALPVVRLLNLEPLQTAPADVERGRVLSHQALVPALEHLLPSLEPIVRQPARRQDHVLPLEYVLEPVAP